MYDGEGWIIPHLNVEVDTSKPPMLFWLIALSGKASRYYGRAGCPLAVSLSFFESSPSSLFSFLQRNYLMKKRRFF
jgi:hypothetical protein